MNEHSYIKSVHAQLKKLPEYREIDVWKINDNWKGGCADALYDGPAEDLWIEYKFIKAPKRPATLCIPALSTQQNHWLTSRYNNGRNIAVIIGSIDGGIIFTEPSDWNSGSYDFLAKTRSTKTIAASIMSFILYGTPLVTKV